MNLAQTIKIYGIGNENSGPKAPCPQCGPGKGGEMEKEYVWNGRPNEPVIFKSGEYAGRTGKVEGMIQKRYSKEQNMLRVQIDGFPKPGGWSGKVTVDQRVLAPKPRTVETELNPVFSDVHKEAKKQARDDTFARQWTLWKTTPGPGMPGSTTRREWDLAYNQERKRISDERSEERYKNKGI